MGYTYTMVEFEQRVKNYFRDCEEVRDVFPDEAGMLNALDIEDDEYAKLKNEEGYKRTILWAKRRRTSWLERQMVSNPRAATGCMNALKQEKNGAYGDKPVQTDRKLIVKLSGLEDRKK